MSVLLAGHVCGHVCVGGDFVNAQSFDGQVSEIFAHPPTQPKLCVGKFFDNVADTYGV